MQAGGFPIISPMFISLNVVKVIMLNVWPFWPMFHLCQTKFLTTNLINQTSTWFNKFSELWRNVKAQHSMSSDLYSNPTAFFRATQYYRTIPKNNYLSAPELNLRISAVFYVYIHHTRQINEHIKQHANKKLADIFTWC